MTGILECARRNLPHIGTIGVQCVYLVLTLVVGHDNDGSVAERITDEKGGVSVFEWSPDRSQIAFLMPEPETEEEEKAKKEKRDQRVIDEDLKMTDLYVVSLERSEGGYPVRKLTKSEFSVGSFRGGGRGGSSAGKNCPR